MAKQVVYLYGHLGLERTAIEMMTQQGITILRGTHDHSDADFLQHAASAQVIIMDDHYFKAAWFAQLPNLGLIIRRGVGYDKIPVDLATQHHVVVANTPGANAVSVAEIAVSLMMMTVRKTQRAQNQLAQFSGQMYPSYLLSHTLSSRTIGLVGYGHIAQATEKMLSGFGARLLVTARHPRTPAYGEFVDLPTLLAQADIVSLHLPATDETNNLFNAQQFAQMKSDAILINTSRGSLVNETDLVAAIQAETLGGAGLDTTSQEPVPASSPLLQDERIVVLPHVGGFTAEAEVKTARMVADNVLDWYAGRTPRYALNEI